MREGLAFERRVRCASDLAAITYYSTLRHLVLARLLVISKSRPSHKLANETTSEGIFMARSAKKCLPNESFLGGGCEGVVFAKNTPSGKSHKVIL